MGSEPMIFPSNLKSDSALGRVGSIAATDQKNSPDPLTHRSVTVTDPPVSLRRATDPDEDEPGRPRASALPPRALNSSADVHSGRTKYKEGERTSFSALSKREEGP